MALNVPSLDELVEPFKGLKTGALKEEAKAAGIPFTTFWKLVTGRTADPRIETVRLLADYVKRRKAAAKRKADVYQRGDGTIVRDQRNPQSAKEWIAPKRRATDHPQG